MGLEGNGFPFTNVLFSATLDLLQGVCESPVSVQRASVHMVTMLKMV